MTRFFWRLTPRFFRRLIVHQLRKLFMAYNRERRSSMQTRCLTSAELQNLKVVADRAALLEHLPKKAVVAEIGVAEGRFARQIFEITDPEKLLLIDKWSSKRYPPAMMEEVIAHFSAQIARQKVQVLKGDSVEMLAGFPDRYFDWVYVDTSHDYDTTWNELNICERKVKDGGIIAGHDYIRGNWDNGLVYGVIEAVNRFCVEKKWELVLFSFDYPGAPSFAIRRRVQD